MTDFYQDQRLNDLFLKSETHFYKNYYCNLHTATLVPFKELSDCNCPSYFKLQLSTSPTYYELSTISTLLISLYSMCTTFSFIIDVTSTQIIFYIGLRSDSNTNCPVQLFQKLFYNKNHRIDISSLHPENINSIVSTTLTPDSTQLTSSFFTDFLNQTKGQCFKFFLFATPLCNTIYNQSANNIQELFTALTPFRNYECNHHHHHTTTCTDTHTTNTNQSQNTSCTEGKTTTSAHNNSNSCTQALTLNSNKSTFVTVNQNNNTSSNKGNTDTLNNSLSNTNANQCVKSDTETHSTGITDLTINSTRYQTENRRAQMLITQATQLLDYYHATFKLPLYTFNTFVTACDLPTALLANSTYINLLPTQPLYNTFINTWSQNCEDFEVIKCALLNLQLPKFCLSFPEKLYFDLGLPVTSSSLSDLIYNILSYTPEAPTSTTQDSSSNI